MQILPEIKKKTKNELILRHGGVTKLIFLLLISLYFSNMHACALSLCVLLSTFNNSDVHAWIRLGSLCDYLFDKAVYNRLVYTPMIADDLPSTFT